MPVLSLHLPVHNNIQIYQESFTQDEINAIIAFHKSPTGILIVDRMPTVMQKSGVAMQAKMLPMMERMKAVAAKAAAEAKAESDAEEGEQANAPDNKPAAKPDNKVKAKPAQKP